jgi:hypothetical protein
MISDDLIAIYRNRWRAVEEIERQEAQTDSIELRWKQLISLVNLARGLNILPTQDEDETAVIMRWAKLKSST